MTRALAGNLKGHPVTMPKRNPSHTGGLVFHVLNRGIRKQRLFDTPADYDAFVALMGWALQVVPTRLLAYCLMPNHFHLVLWPSTDLELSRFMLRLSGTHAMRRHLVQGTKGTGPIYQGRFRSFPVADDRHFLCVCRYVERNPIRAGLAERAEDWRWSSLSQRYGRRAGVYLTDWPVERPSSWLRLVNDMPEPPAEVDLVRRAVTTGRPLGPAAWVQQVAEKLRIEKSLRNPGRPPHDPLSL
jgi:putative transposase